MKKLVHSYVSKNVGNKFPKYMVAADRSVTMKFRKGIYVESK